MMASPLLLENVWLQQQKFEDAELLYRLIQVGASKTSQKVNNSLTGDIAQVRKDIQKALNQPVVGAAFAGGDVNVCQRLDALEKENKELRKITDELRSLILNVQASTKQAAAASTPASSKSQEPVPAAADEEDDCDLFGSDDEETKAIKEKRLQEYAEKKANKPGPIAKSSVVLDVKPWDDETDMVEMERRVRSIEQDGLVWGASKLVPVGYGINKLSIMCVVEDEKVSIDDLSERITENNEDLVQSVDVAAFNKI